MKLFTCLVAILSSLPVLAQLRVEETNDRISISTSALDAAVNKKGYVTGIAAGSLLDRQSGFRDAGFGLDIVDWIMEGGSDKAYRDQLPREMVYQFDNAYHGKTPKRSIEGPQICTQAKELSPRAIKGKDFIAIHTAWNYRTAAPGYKTGSTWEQTIVFPEGKRYFVSSDKVTSVNDLNAPFLRLDMPGHIKHKGGDTFSEVYLSYLGKEPIPANQFDQNFAPDEKLNYRRDRNEIPKRFIRAYHLRDPKTGKAGPWLAGMTLRPEVVTEAWCHQRDYVCFIEEFGPPPGHERVKPGESFAAAFVVGYFDSIEDMEKTYDQYAGATTLEASEAGWRLAE
ncbi:MAG TPA: hypothetical protein VH475_24765 [Tepidisphaeraceae bacterium]|jgi:hypothetical protein